MVKDYLPLKIGKALTAAPAVRLKYLSTSEARIALLMLARTGRELSVEKGKGERKRCQSKAGLVVFRVELFLIMVQK